jgi:hypothetical protein
MRHITIIRRVMFDNQMDPLFLIVTGYQRALGELMIRRMIRPVSAPGNASVTQNFLLG